jgi:ABC-type uncharacterized transport system ATPase subunit
MSIVEENRALPHVELRDVTKRYGAFQAITDLSLSIGKGQFCALLGPSRLRQVNAVANDCGT